MASHGCNIRLLQEMRCGNRPYAKGGLHPQRWNEGMRILLRKRNCESRSGQRQILLQLSMGIVTELSGYPSSAVAPRTYFRRWRLRVFACARSNCGTEGKMAMSDRTPNTVASDPANERRKAPILPSCPLLSGWRLWLVFSSTCPS
jgi:hypothetical protein